MAISIRTREYNLSVYEAYNQVKEFGVHYLQMTNRQAVVTAQKIAEMTAYGVGVIAKIFRDAQDAIYSQSIATTAVLARRAVLASGTRMIQGIAEWSRQSGRREAPFSLEREPVNIREGLPNIIPEEFQEDPNLNQHICPITQAPIRFPICLRGGEGPNSHDFHFEWNAIKQWIERCQGLGSRITNPSTNMPCDLGDFRINIDMQEEIENRLAELINNRLRQEVVVSNDPSLQQPSVVTIMPLPAVVHERSVDQFLVGEEELYRAITQGLQAKLLVDERSLCRIIDECISRRTYTNREQLYREKIVNEQGLNWVIDDLVSRGGLVDPNHMSYLVNVRLEELINTFVFEVIHQRESFAQKRAAHYAIVNLTETVIGYGREQELSHWISEVESKDPEYMKRVYYEISLLYEDIGVVDGDINFGGVFFRSPTTDPKYRCQAIANADHTFLRQAIEKLDKVKEDLIRERIRKFTVPRVYTEPLRLDPKPESNGVWC